MPEGPKDPGFDSLGFGKTVTERFSLGALMEESHLREKGMQFVSEVNLVRGCDLDDCLLTSQPYVGTSVAEWLEEGYCDCGREEVANSLTREAVTINRRVLGWVQVVLPQTTHMCCTKVMFCKTGPSPRG